MLYNLEEYLTLWLMLSHAQWAVKYPLKFFFYFIFNAAISVGIRRPSGSDVVDPE